MGQQGQHYEPTRGHLDLRNSLDNPEARGRLTKELGLDNRDWAKGADTASLEKLNYFFSRSPDDYPKQVVSSVPDKAGNFLIERWIKADLVIDFQGEDPAPDKGKAVRLSSAFRTRRDEGEDIEVFDMAVESATHQVHLLGGDSSRVILPKDTVWRDELSEEAQKVWDTLSARKWFINSSAAVQYGLRALVGNEKWLGFVRDLSERDSTSEVFQENSLQSLLANNFGATVVFNVTMPNGKAGQYEYFSWRQGRFSGAKGIIVVEDSDNNPVGVILRRGVKFAPGNKKIVEAVGGFSVGNEEAFQTFLREIEEEVGLKEARVDRMVGLGTILTDSGMTPNEVELFAAVVKTSDARALLEKWGNVDPLEGDSENVFVPLGALSEVVKNLKDSYALAALNKAFALGLVSKKSDKK